MQLDELDKKSLIELKDEIADLEEHVRELHAIRVKQDVPLEVLLEQSSYKAVWDDTYAETEVQTRELATERNDEISSFDGERLTYSTILESGKRYKQVGDGVIGLFALKIFDGIGVFNFMIKSMKGPVFTFTAIPEEKYVLFSRGLILPGYTWFEVKELEGHLRYVLAMSTFSDYEIKEVKQDE